MSRGPNALGSDTSLGLRAEMPPDPKFLNEGKQAGRRKRDWRPS